MKKKNKAASVIFGILGGIALVVVAFFALCKFGPCLTEKLHCLASRRAGDMLDDEEFGSEQESGCNSDSCPI